MSRPFFQTLFILIQTVTLCCTGTVIFAQASITEKVKKASQKIEKGFEKENNDTLASGYYELGESYFQKGEFVKSEEFFQKSKTNFENAGDAEGIAKSSRSLAKVQEELNKNKEALINYNVAQKNNYKTGNFNSGYLNTNDIRRLSLPESTGVQQNLLWANINFGVSIKDTNEIIYNYSRMANMNLKQFSAGFGTINFKNAYRFAQNKPEQALRYNQLITDAYIKQNNFDQAIETKKEALNEQFVQSSSQLKASEITSLASIYIQKKEDSTAIRLLNESYTLSVQNGHTLEARKSIEKLDSIYRRTGKKDMSLKLYKDFIARLPIIIDKDSALSDNKLIEETEWKINKLESEKMLKDDLIRKKNIFNGWLTASVIVLLVLTAGILYVLRKLKIKNKKIALQSLRREMNPHFIFNSLNSINQFIATNNEVEANRYLSKFSALMRGVMENSKEDFILFTKEIQLLQIYLELEKSRFPDQFNFEIQIDDALQTNEQLYIPGMLIQPYLENAIWHGLRYMDAGGFLRLHFIAQQNRLEILVEDNGIGMAESKRIKTENQSKHTGRGISNTEERIKFLNELYHLHINCEVIDKPAPATGVTVKITMPFIKDPKHEN
jgi:tetratricopeptide (TPR) repeat protein